jgi:hypothetical protein
MQITEPVQYHAASTGKNKRRTQAQQENNEQTYFAFETGDAVSNGSTELCDSTASCNVLLKRLTWEPFASSLLVSIVMGW